MEKQEILYMTTKAIAKGWNTDKLEYSDDMYGREEYTDEVSEYMDEYLEVGRKAFYEKYKEYKLYGN